jgi:hypothetical protein
MLIAVAVTATALAASPKKSAKFKGTLSYHGTQITVGNFSAPVSFKVSSSGKKVLSFKYGDLGCFGYGGLGTKNPFTLPGVTKRFGAMSVSSSGRFSAPATKSTHKASGGTGKNKFTTAITTTSSLTGRFASAKKATGTITFSQSDVTNGGKPSTCGPVTLAFSATAH